MPSIVKQAWTNPLRFNFLPLKAMFSFITVKFSLMKTLVFWLKLCFSLSKFCNFLLFNRTFLQCFLFRKYTVFLFVAIWFPYSITCFKIIGGNNNLNVREHWDHCFLQIPVRNMCWDSWNSNSVSPTILLYALTADSLDMASFSSLLHFSCNFSFSSRSLLITMSLRFIISSLRWFIVAIYSYYKSS